MLKIITINAGTAIAAFLLASSAHAQAARNILVQSTGLQCSTQAGSGSFAVASWSVGASNVALTTTGASGRETVGKAQMGPVNLVRSFDECSPALFGVLASGMRLQTVTLNDRDAAGRPNIIVQLQNAYVSQYTVSDGGTSPVESLSLTYDRITITNTANGTKFCWDLTSLRSCS